MNLIGTRGKPETVSGVPLKGLKEPQYSYGYLTKAAQYVSPAKTT
jgi:hypothetical protein